MKTLFEPINANSSFFVEKDLDNETIYFRSVQDYEPSPNYISFVIEKEEAINLANYILKLYSE